MLTAQQIVDKANALARQFYQSMGYEVREGYRFDQARHPQEQGMWNLAVMAYEFIEGTDVESALSEIES
jgi:hypothetical protein